MAPNDDKPAAPMDGSIEDDLEVPADDAVKGGFTRPPPKPSGD